MTEDPFDAALDGFERWTATTKRKLSADPVGEIETALDLMRDYLDIDSPADLGAGDLKELLLRIYPRKMTVFDAADTENTVPGVRDFVAYLAESGEVTEGTARTLERELDEIAPRFTEVMMDPSNWGMAGSLVHAMAADGVDLDDQAAVDRWIGSYNADLPGIDYEEEDEDDVVDLKEAFGLPTFAYQVSGEYSQIKAAAMNGWIDGERIMMETLLAFKRAGCDGILTYFAAEVAKILAKR